MKSKCFSIFHIQLGGLKVLNNRNLEGKQVDHREQKLNDDLDRGFQQHEPLLDENNGHEPRLDSWTLQRK